MCPKWMSCGRGQAPIQTAVYSLTDSAEISHFSRPQSACLQNVDNVAELKMLLHLIPFSSIKFNVIYLKYKQDRIKQ